MSSRLRLNDILSSGSARSEGPVPCQRPPQFRDHHFSRLVALGLCSHQIFAAQQSHRAQDEQDLRNLDLAAMFNAALIWPLFTHFAWTVDWD